MCACKWHNKDSVNPKDKITLKQFQKWTNDDKDENTKVIWDSIRRQIIPFDYVTYCARQCAVLVDDNIVPKKIKDLFKLDIPKWCQTHTVTDRNLLGQLNAFDTLIIKAKTVTQ